MADERRAHRVSQQTCIRVGPNIAVPTDAKSSGASLPSTLVPGAWASGITLSAHHAPRTSLGGGKVVVSHTDIMLQGLPWWEHGTFGHEASAIVGSYPTANWCSGTPVRT